VALAVLSLVAALSSGVAMRLGSNTTPTHNDPEIENQAATLVLAPANDDNFTPPGACGGTAVAPSRCTAAVWVVNGSSSTLDYSGVPCSTSPSLQVIVLSGQNIDECTAAGFLAPGTKAPAPGAPAPPPVGTAITGFQGAQCIPADCRLFLVLAQADGDFNAPGLCGGNADIIGPCMVAAFDTTGAVGATTISQPNTACPASGDVTQACTANPGFFPADMVLTLPAKATAAPAVAPVHGIEVADQAATIVLAPVGDKSFDTPNTCGTWGINPVSRCTAAVMQVGVTDVSASYSSSSCPIDIPADVSPCTSAAFTASDGKTAFSGYPGSLCFGTAPPAAPGAAAPPAPQVRCQLFVVLTPSDGDFNAPGKCSGYTIISAACTVAVVDTTAMSDQAGGETVSLKTTSLCLAPPADPSDITSSCTSPSFSILPINFTLPQS